MILYYKVDTVRRIRSRVVSRHFRRNRAITAAREVGAEGYSVAYSVPGGRIAGEFIDGKQLAPASPVPASRA